MTTITIYLNTCTNSTVHGRDEEGSHFDFVNRACDDRHYTIIGEPYTAQVPDGYALDHGADDGTYLYHDNEPEAPGLDYREAQIAGLLTAITRRES